MKIKKIVFTSLAFISSISSCEFKANSAANQNKEQKMEEKAELPFPLTVSFSEDYLKANFYICNYTEAGDRFAYWVNLPNFIKPTVLKPTAVEKLKVINAGFYESIDKEPRIEVWAAYETLKEPIETAEWLLSKIKMTDAKVLKQNIINSPNGDKNIDVLTAQDVGDGETVIARWIALKRDNDYLVVKATCGKDDYMKHADTIFYIVSHWNFANQKL